MNKREIKKFTKKNRYKKYPTKHDKILARKLIRHLDYIMTKKKYPINPMLLDISEAMYNADIKKKRDTLFTVADYCRSARLIKFDR